MRAAVMRGGKIVVDTVPDPEPQSGEILVRTLACGICGSDLHALQHGDLMVEASREAGAPTVMDLSRDVIMGHEFCSEILDYGPDTARRSRPGDRVIHPALLIRGAEFHGIGYSNDVPGGFAERMVLSESMMLPVPEGVPSEHAALTEPIAVGIHAVARGRVSARDSAVVIGCGPVGLAVIAGLALEKVEPIVAADFSPMRRALAERLGAHIAVDPQERSPFAAWSEAAQTRPPVVFECVGVPGVLQGLIREAPRMARIVVVGVSMEEERVKPMVAIVKELTVRFSFGYSLEEFAQTFRTIAEGKIEVDPLITGRVGLEGVSAAFEDLRHPDRHAKIMVEPAQSS
ncbi:MAG: zinc-binding dehydrogenase [Deltaproteobacteria bacterium]|nr:zinc-binding dehydrogenase [Deltaproteobacteria bacterium]